MSTGTTEVAGQSSLLMLVVNFMAWFKSFTFLTLLAISTSSHAKTITLASDEWCPYICTTLDKPGYIVELVKQVLNEPDVEVVFQQMPLSRALSLTEKGEIDIVLALSNEHFQSHKLRSNSVAVGNFSYGYFARKGYNWRYDGDKSLVKLLKQGGRLGLIKDYTYSDLVNRLEQEYPNQVFRAHGEQPLRNLIAMANKDRVDVIIDSYNSINYLTNTYQQQPLVYVGSDSESFPMFIGFSPAFSQKNIEQFDIDLKAVIASPTTEKLLDKYHVRDWRDADKNVSQ